MPRRTTSSVEWLEARIAPAALVVVNPIADLVAGVGKTSASIDLGHLFDNASTEASYRTHVEFTTNFDIDPATPGLQAGKIVLELFDDKTQFSAQNFLNYVNSASARGDYDGVFFHRSVNQAFGSTDSSGNLITQNLQILQAGGFEAAKPGTHIPVGVTVHNEYDANDAELQNTLGTLAMAKTSQGANTGTSEFYFNMGDNSQTLGGANNGGFTVFGKVTEGLAVLQTIFAQPTVDISGSTKNSALSTTPYQGTYNADPDQNLNTPAPVPTASQFITITSAKVLAPANGVSDGVTYSIVGFTNPNAAGAASDLITGKLTGDQLSLAFAKNKIGAADVTIRAERSGFDPVDETFRVTIGANLALTSAGDTLNALIGPGDTGIAKATVANNGGGTLIGDYVIDFYLSKLTSGDSNGTVLGDDDVLIGSVAKSFSLASGKSTVVSANVSILPEVVSGNPTYRVIALAHAVGDTSEVFTDDNLMIDGTLHQEANIFGSYTDGSSLLRKTGTITYQDADGYPVTAKITGPGYGQLTTDGNGHLDLEFFNTTAKTSISVTPMDVDHLGLHTTLRNVTIRGDADIGAAAGTISMGLVDLTGSFEASGGVKALTLGDVLRTTHAQVGDPFVQVTDTHFLTLGSSTALAKTAATVKVGSLDNTTIESAQILKSLTIASWGNTVTISASTFAGLQKFLASGNVDADLDISAVYADDRFTTATTAAATTTTASFKVVGELGASTVHFAGNVGTVDLGTISATKFLVGADAVPTTVEGFSAVRSIGSFTLRGVAGTPFAFSDSDVVAAKFKAIKILNGSDAEIETSSGNDSFGFVADSIAAYNRAGSPAINAKNLTLGQIDTQDHYTVRLL